MSDGRVLVKWLPILNYLRNSAAHHARLWSRTLTLKPANINPAQVPEKLAHAQSVGRNDKLYLTLAIVAVLAEGMDGPSNWPNRMRTLVRKFPAITGMGPEVSMGFPDGWESLPLWRDRTD